MGCDFRFWIQAFDGSVWRTVFSWRSKTGCGGYPLSNAVWACARIDGIWGSYRCVQKNEESDEEQKKQRRTEEEEEESDEESDEDEEKNDRLYYSREMLDELISRVSTFLRETAHTHHTLDELRWARQLCDLCLLFPVKLQNGWFSLENGAEIVDRLRETHAAVLVLPSALRNLVRCYLYPEAAMDVRFVYSEDEGTAATIRKNEKFGKLPDSHVNQLGCPIS